jgi:PmbA protein
VTGRGSDLLRACRWAVERARRLGAAQADAFAERTRQASVTVRNREVEQISQATGKGLGLRVFLGGRLGFAYTSDLGKEGLCDVAARAMALARAAARDSHHGLPKEAELARGARDLLGMYDPAIEALDTQWMLDASLEMERAARAEDPRVAGFESVGAGDLVSEVALVTSTGFSGTYRGTSVYMYAVPVARGDDGQLQTGYWVDARRRLADLEPPEVIGRTAARRAARMLGARKVKTKRVPVVFEPLVAASFVAGLAAAVDGDMVYKKSSFLGDRLGDRVAPDFVTVVDDGLRPGGLSTAPFDGEGVATRRTAIVEKGRLTSFLYDTYTARKAKACSTGSARRGYAGLPEIRTSNLYLEAGSTPAASLVRGLREGFYVTSMLGRGADPVTGDYSRGANGLWIRAGEFAEPVQEVTVSGNMLEMLRVVDAVGDDLDFRGSTGAPTIRFAELMVAGA